MAILFAAIITSVFGITGILLKWFLERPRIAESTGASGAPAVSSGPTEPSKPRRALYVGWGWDHRRRKNADFCVFWFLTIDASGNVWGVSIVAYPGEEPHAYRLWGSVSRDSCQLHYDICGDAGLSTGCITVDLGIDPSRLQGTFTGYSHRDPKNTSARGWVDLRRCPADAIIA